MICLIFVSFFFVETSNILNLSDLTFVNSDSFLSLIEKNFVKHIFSLLKYSSISFFLELPSKIYFNLYGFPFGLSLLLPYNNQHVFGDMIVLSTISGIVFLSPKSYVISPIFISRKKLTKIYEKNTNCLYNNLLTT